MYQAGFPPFNPDVKALAEYVTSELQKLAQSQFDSVSVMRFSESNREPAKPRDGDVAFADGTNWNPASGGRGFYGYYGSAWHRLG